MAKKELDLSFLLPVYETLELPSKGKFYTKNPPLKDGLIKIRAMTTKEEKIIDAINGNTFYQNWCDIIRLCVNSAFDAKDLTFNDFIYLLFYLRVKSYGSMYSITTKCDECGKENKLSINIGEFETKFLFDDIIEPFEIELPVSNIKILTKIPRMRDIIESSRKSYSETKIKGKKVSTETFMRAICTTSMVLPNSDNTVLENPEDMLTILEIYEMLPANDSLYLKKFMNKFDHGLLEPILVTCKECGELFKQYPVITPDLFRPDTRE
ncbi:hypothetical protein EOM09_02095 [bacterium]|nr:hypothetical protein [bacterium]